jgi:hypothetical protein
MGDFNRKSKQNEWTSVPGALTRSGPPALSSRNGQLGQLFGGWCEYQWRMSPEAFGNQGELLVTD